MEEGVLENKEENNVVFWADKIAEKVIERDGDTITVASGITPSGTVHIGNLREEMTAAIVAKALEDSDHKVRYIHSWDDFDRFRKVPGNLPEDKKEEFEDYLGMPVSKVPDPYECHDSYSEHFEKEFEESVKDIGINPEYLYQSEKYQNCEYAEGIKIALNRREEIQEILAKFKSNKEEFMKNDFWPVSIYCEECWKDFTDVIDYNGEYSISYSCKCGHEGTFDFREVGNIKLGWRVDWPMRWKHENVLFEPGGKDHSAPGSSRSTGTIIAKEIYDYEAPLYQMYDFVLAEGGEGKMSGSSGNVIDPDEMKKVYLPEVFRYLYVSNKPVKEFKIHFDDGINATYENFYMAERVYFGNEEARSDTKEEHWKRVYELSQVDGVPEKQPVQVSFNLMSQLSQFMSFEDSIEKLKELGHIDEISEYDKERLENLYNNSKYWMDNYNEDNKIEIGNSKVEDLSEEQKEAMEKVSEILTGENTQEDLNNKLFEIAKSTVGPRDFFTAAYLTVIGKERGPRLAELIKIIGEKEVKEIIDKAV